MPKESNVVFIYNQADVETWVNEIIVDNLSKSDRSHQENLLKDYRDLVMHGMEDRQTCYTNLVVQYNFDAIQLGLGEKMEGIKQKCGLDHNGNLEFIFKVAKEITNKTEAHKNNPEGFNQMICQPLNRLYQMYQKVNGNFSNPENRMLFLNELHKLYVSTDKYLAGHSDNTPFRGSDGTARISFVKSLRNNLQAFVLGFNYKYMNTEQKEKEKAKIKPWYVYVTEFDRSYIKVQDAANKNAVITQRTYKISGKEELAKFDQIIHPVKQEDSVSLTKEDIINTEYAGVSAKISKYVRPAENEGSGLEKLVHAAEVFAGTFSQEHNEKAISFNKLIKEPLQAYANAVSMKNSDPSKADTALMQLYYDASLYLNTHKNPHTDKGQACRAFANMIQHVADRCIHHECAEYRKQIEADSNKKINEKLHEPVIGL